MIQLIKKLFGLGGSVDYKELINSGAQIIDVRTKEEFQQGHVKGSVNIPLQGLQKELNKISKAKPVITCCASGMRSAVAKSTLIDNGFNPVYNGGGWSNLQNKLQ